MLQLEYYINEYHDMKRVDRLKNQSMETISHYFTHELNKYNNCFFDRVNSVTRIDNTLIIEMRINATTNYSFQYCNNITVTYNLQTNEYKLKATGKGARKNIYNITRTVKNIINECFYIGAGELAQDLEENTFITSKHFSNLIRSIEPDSRKQTILSNEMLHNITHKNYTINDCYDYMNKLIESKNKSYTVGNRSFISYNEALLYCNSVDYDETMIIVS